MFSVSKFGHDQSLCLQMFYHPWVVIPNFTWMEFDGGKIVQLLNHTFDSFMSWLGILKTLDFL